MKTKFTKKGRRILSAALCLLMMITALPMSAFAWTSEEGKSCTSSFGDYYVGSDGEYYRSKATYSFIVYDSKGNITVQSINAGNAKRKYLMTDNSGTHQVYCVESGVDFNTGNSYVSKSGKNSSYFQNLPTDAQFGIMMALMYGWHEGKSSPVAGTNADDYAFATQTIIWEYQQQLRTSPSNRQSANGIDGDTYYYSLKGRPAEKCYDWILSQMSKHYTIPSFAARSQSNADTYTLKYNPDTKKYSLTLEDTNNTLSDIKFSASGISVTRSGNKYTFTSDKMITSPVTVSAQKNVNLDCGEMLIWGCVGKQTMVSGASDPVYFYLKIDTETYGTGQIKKTSEDGVVSGISFNISGNGVNKTVTTGADGTVDVQLKSIIDRCTASVYRHYQQGNYQGVPPTLQDFREELLKQDEPEAKEIALAIELFTDGSLNTFAKHTNVDTHSRLICYDILDLGKQLQPIGMLVVLDSILNRITQNRAKGRNTFIFIDEIYLLFQHEYSANFLFTLWKRVRKYGAYCTGITQNVDDLLQSHTARTMLANSEFIIMLNQASTDRIELAKLLNISDLQMSYITNVGAGQGLLKVGSSLVPFVNKFPRNTELYRLMTTKFGET